jgi:hypothetical protein
VTSQAHDTTLNLLRDNSQRLNSKLGLMFSSSALAAGGPEKAAPNTANARKAYNTALCFAPKMLLTAQESKQIDAAFARLKRELLQLGQSIADPSVRSSTLPNFLPSATIELDNANISWHHRKSTLRKWRVAFAFSAFSANSGLPPVDITVWTRFVRTFSACRVQLRVSPVARIAYSTESR